MDEQDLLDEQGLPKAAPPVQHQKVDRRRILKLFGLGALGVAPLPILPNVLKSVFSPGRGPMRNDVDVARAPNGRVRRWTMIIDLRNCDGCQSVGKPPQCTTACIEGHFAPEPMEWIQVFESRLPGDGTQEFLLPGRFQS